MKNYYYIVVDTLAKTLEIFPSGTCQAVTENNFAKIKLGIENLNGLQSIQFENRFKFIFNGTDNKINLNKIFKYARKYTII